MIDHFLEYSFGDKIVVYCKDNIYNGTLNDADERSIQLIHAKLYEKISERKVKVVNIRLFRDKIESVFKADEISE